MENNMKNYLWTIVLGLVMSFPNVLSAAEPKPAQRKPSSETPPSSSASQIPEYEPNSNYTIRNIEGWSVYINNRLLDENKKLAAKTLTLLTFQLFEINRRVPQGPLNDLHKVPIWIEVDNDKHAPCAQYHPSRDWLKNNGFNPQKAKSVEISRADLFLQWTHDQPFMVLHELAHGYHHRVLGHDNQRILTAYKNAVAGKKYESVLRISGKTDRHYALNNAKEYFAEATEAYFGTNDFYPFVRAELKQHDPDMYKTMQEIWGRPARN
jgi:hypothetical protein